MCVCVHAYYLSQNLVKYCFIVQVIAAELEISRLCFDHFKGPPQVWQRHFSTYSTVEKCRTMSRNVKECREMSKNSVEKCRKMSKNVEKCCEMSRNVEEMISKPMLGTTFFYILECR